MRRPEALAALGYHDFRLIWAGQFCSMLGNQFQTVALAWLVYSMTNSPAQLGAIGLARAIPTMLLSLFGGTLADQVDRRKLLIISQSILALLSATLALTVSAGVATVPLLYGFAFVTAGAAAFDSPARQAIVPALVPRERLSNAITLNVLAQNTAMVLGPAAGGVVISMLGPSVAFWTNATTCFVVVAALLLMRTRPAIPIVARRGWPALVAGLSFVRERTILWQLMLLDFLAMLFVSTMGLLPVFARDVLQVGAQGVGLLYAAPSAGAVIGAALFAFVPSPRRPGRMVALAMCGYGLVLAMFGLSQSFAVALLFLAFAGGLDSVSMAMRHTVRQLATPDDYRGRVGALASVFSAGGPRLGDFQAGVLASLVGARGAMVIGGGACILMVLSSRIWAKNLWVYKGDEAPHPTTLSRDEQPKQDIAGVGASGSQAQTD